MDKKLFEVEISNGGAEGYQTSAVLAMPCTQAELRDALQKARVRDIDTCRNELTRIRYPGITSDMIGRNVDLPELNLLALRLTMLSEDDRMGLDCLLQIEKENHATPFPLSRLINLTFNADICLLAPQVSNPKELGALLYEGEMLSDEAMALVDSMDEDSDFRERLLELLGEQHQEEHGGVFTSRGYAEPGGDFKEVYRKGEMFCFAHPSAPVVLEVRKEDKGAEVTVSCPDIEGRILEAMKRYKGASPETARILAEWRVDYDVASMKDREMGRIKLTRSAPVNAYGKLMFGQNQAKALLEAPEKAMTEALKYIKEKKLKGSYIRRQINGLRSEIEHSSTISFSPELVKALKEVKL